MMNKLQFCYRMHLDFVQPVIKHYVHLRCIPLTDSIQQIYGLKKSFSPAIDISYLKDGFGNCLVACRLPAPHLDFTCEVEGVAYVDQSKKKKEELMPCYQYSSPLTSPGKELLSWLTTSFVSSGNLFADANLLMHLLYSQYEYVSGVTDIHTDANKAWALRKGVCQDFAHIYLAMCRANKIPARYVAGLMIGEGATHAWTEIYIDGCWIGMDPTHDQVVDNNYIKLAQGRDFKDCALERGIFFGAELQHQEISVVVKPG